MEASKGIGQTKDNDGRSGMTNAAQKGGDRQANSETKRGDEVEQTTGPCLG